MSRTTIDRAKLLASLEEHLPEFDADAAMAVHVYPSYVVVDLYSSGKPCWKPGCTDKTAHSHPRRWDVRGAMEVRK